MSSDTPLYCFLAGFIVLAFAVFYCLFIVALDDDLVLTPVVQCECLNSSTTYVYPTCPAVVQEQAPATVTPTVTPAATPTPYPEVRAQTDGYPRDTMPCCGVVTKASEFPFLGGA